MIDHYLVLQIAESADQELIAAAYKRLVQKYHPDRNKDPLASRRTQLLNDAYAILSDPAKRQSYDIERRTQQEFLRHQDQQDDIDSSSSAYGHDSNFAPDGFRNAEESPPFAHDDVNSRPPPMDPYSQSEPEHDSEPIRPTRRESNAEWILWCLLLILSAGRYRWTYRPQNECCTCAYTWFPRGKNLSIRCPHCGSENVGYRQFRLPASFGPKLDWRLLAAVVFGGYALCLCSGLLGTLLPPRKESSDIEPPTNFTEPSIAQTGRRSEQPNGAVSKTKPEIPPLLDSRPNPITAKNSSPVLRDGSVVLKAKVAVIKGADAWVEVDNKHWTNWKVGTKEVTLVLPAGTYRVTVYSIYEGVRRKFLDKFITVAPDATTEIPVGP